MELNLFTAAAAGAVLGGAMVWLLMRATLGRRVAEATAATGAALASAETRLGELLARIVDLTERLAARELEVRDAQVRLAALGAEKARLESEVASAAEREALLAQQSITDLLRPLDDTLRQVDTKLAAVERDRLTTTARLDEQIRALGTSLTALSGQTGDLVKALRQPHIRGHWGEVQLRRIVELAGMVEHCDFVEQPTLSTPDGRLRPDLIVRLPGAKTIVVDAKAPLSAYLEAIDGEEATRASKLLEHARQVRDHMSRLSAKEYADQFAASPDFVIMFLPGESVFSAAVHADPALIESGVSQRVIPASPTTLIAMLKGIAFAWRQERIAHNAERISELGRELYQRLAVTATHVETVGTSLTRAVEAYNRAVGSLEARVLPAARRFRELGSAPDTEIEPLQPVQASVRAVQAPEFQNLLEIVDPPAPS